MPIILKNTKVRKKDKFGNASTKVGDTEIINRDVSGNITPGEPRKTAATTDVSQPFKSSEFESLKEYEKAKQKASVLTKTPEQVQQEAVQKKLEAIAVENAVNKELLGQVKTTQAQPTTKEVTAQGTTEQVQTNEQANMETFEPTIKSIFGRKGTGKNIITGEPNGSMTTSETMQTLKDIFKVETKAFTTAYSVVRSFLSRSGKSVTQDEFDNNWGNLKSSIQTNLNLLGQGIGDYDTIQDEINKAEMVNNKFEAAANKASSYSLNYFATDGGDAILEEAALNKNTINNWRTELEQAQIAGQLKTARAGL
ncbi:MAG: hypothetical protein PHS54_02930 [Clostridia bacterium]|nr:hypothetical protein [Clostridia bacterium]